MVESFFESLEKRRRSKTLRILCKRINSVIKKPIKKIITKKVITVNEEDTLYDVVEAMSEVRKGTLVVLRYNKPIGLISETDFLKINFDKESLKLKVEDIIGPNLVFVSPDISLLEAHKTMLKNKLRKLVVLEKNKLIGILTQTDILTELDKFASKTSFDVDVGGWGLVRHVMRKDIIIMPKRETVPMARDIMKTKGSDYVFIMKGNRPMGIVTTNDIVNQIFLNVHRLNKSFVDSIMSAPIATISPDITIFEANKTMLMLEKNFRRLPVVLVDKVLGIVTQTDIMKAIFSFYDGILSSEEKGGTLDIELTEE